MNPRQTPDPARRWTLGDVKSAAWVPQQRATLLFVIRDGRILLIHKKRGLGRGKINGPGGRLDPGETALEAALREVREELCVEVRAAHAAGRLKFQFIDGLSLDVMVFIAGACEGDPRETDEAAPLWVSTDAIPYARMWPDDEHWIPLMLAGTPFLGHFLFDGDAMLAHDVGVVERAAVERAGGVRYG